jgi:hypothetical protein
MNRRTILITLKEGRVGEQVSQRKRGPPPQPLPHPICSLFRRPGGGRCEVGSSPKVVFTWLYFKIATCTNFQLFIHWTICVRPPINHSIHRAWEDGWERGPSSAGASSQPGFGILSSATREGRQQCLADTQGLQRPGASGYTDIRPPKEAKDPQSVEYYVCTYIFKY